METMAAGRKEVEFETEFDDEPITVVEPRGLAAKMVWTQGEGRGYYRFTEAAAQLTEVR